MLHRADHFFDDKIDLFLGIEAADAEPDAAMGQVVGDPHGPKDIAGLNAGGSACGTRAYGHSLHGHHQGFSLDMGEAEVQVARQAFPGMTVEGHVVQGLYDSTPEALAQGKSVFALLGYDLAAQITGQAETDNEWNR